MLKFCIVFAVLFVLLALLVIGVLYFAGSSICGKLRKTDNKLEPGDVVLKRMYPETSSSAIGILYFVDSDICGKLHKTDNELEPGDVILKRMYSENPFNDCEWMCETVTEVKANGFGKLYFKSYTSDRNGVRSSEQNMHKSEHCEGMEYRPDEWEKINHIEL